MEEATIAQGPVDVFVGRLVDEQRDVMRHALGLGRMIREYRNHFVTSPGTTDYPHCEALVAAGLMRRREGNPLSGGAPIYSVTDAGRAALKTPNAALTGREPKEDV